MCISCNTVVTTHAYAHFKFPLGSSLSRKLEKKGGKETRLFLFELMSCRVHGSYPEQRSCTILSFCKNFLPHVVLPAYPIKPKVRCWEVIPDSCPRRDAQDMIMIPQAGDLPHNIDTLHTRVQSGVKILKLSRHPVKTTLRVYAT